MCLKENTTMIDNVIVTMIHNIIVVALVEKEGNQNDSVTNSHFIDYVLNVYIHEPYVIDEITHSNKINK